jgi:hypothetical protein
MRPGEYDAFAAVLDADIQAHSAPQVLLQALDLAELAAIKFKPREPILEPWINSQELVMVFGPRGVGKTHFLLGAAFAIATGAALAKWTAPKPRRVLYLDGELPGIVMQARLAMHCPSVDPQPGYFRVFTPDLLPDGAALPDISTTQGQMQVEAMLGDAEVVFLDNLSAWARTGRENEAESWLPVAGWLLSLRRRGVAVVLVHHAGKGGQQRGTSKREDLLDAVVGLSRPTDYDPSQGAVFVAEFTKARHLSGNQAESIELALEDRDGDAVWAWRTVEASTYDRVVALTRDGLKPAEICAELDVHKSQVSRHIKRARELGDLPKGSAS